MITERLGGEKGVFKKMDRARMEKIVCFLKK